MEAAEAKVQKVLEGNKQFLVPHYQRPYSWQEAQWKALWNDILELTEEDDPKPHFLGSIVTAPARSVPEGIEKRLLIDGQQRLTTLVVLLVVLRNLALERGLQKTADRIADLITNRHEDGHERYRLLPTQGEDPSFSDRETLMRLIDAAPESVSGGIADAAKFFSSRLRRVDAPDPERLYRAVTGRLTLVSIILDEKDNPHRIFESLNGKGRPLTQADLIRNYFFMRIHEREHERLYRDYWRPMQQRLGEELLTDFVRHFLTRTATVVREADVYSSLKERVDGDRERKPEDHLKELAQFAAFYEVLLRPENAPSKAIRARLERLNRLEVTVAYPLLLPAYADVISGALEEGTFCRVLDCIETFMVRRFVCNVPTYGLNKSFAPLYSQARSSDDFAGTVERTLGRACPGDSAFRDRLADARLYGGGERLRKTKLLLERLEALGEKEIVPGETLTIEHVMPQTLTDLWKDELGPTWEDDHERLLHTLGNLTLTGFNSELGNLPFAEKKGRLRESNVSLNRHFRDVERWTAEQIEQRADLLVERAMTIWPSFAPVESTVDNDVDRATHDVTGTVPRLVRIRGQETPVQSWVDVAVATAEAIAAIGEAAFSAVVGELPKFLNTDATAFRRSSRLRKLTNGAYLETNLSASAIYRLCLQAVETAGLQLDEWSVEHAPSDDGDSGPEGTSQVKQLQLEFWTLVRESLLATGAWTSLRSARAQREYDIPLGRTGIHLAATVNSYDKKLKLKLVMMPEHAQAALRQLLEQRNEVEAELGFALDWDPSPDKRVRVLRTMRAFDILQRDAWPDAVQWASARAVTMHKAFAPRVAALNLG